MEKPKVQLDDAALTQFIEVMKRSNPKIRIGILSDSAHGSSKKTNVEIASIHEYGSNGYPKRSFLRMPLNTLLTKRVAESDLASNNSLAEVFNTRSLMVWMTKISHIAFAIVMEGFATEGFGKWPKWKRKGYTSQTGMILQDTTQMRDSITTEVTE